YGGDFSIMLVFSFLFFFSSRRRHTRWPRDWSSDVCSSDLSFLPRLALAELHPQAPALHAGIIFDAWRDGLGDRLKRRQLLGRNRSEERRVGKECRSRWWACE